MALTGDRTFVGFGFGPIQAGLFLFEAFRSGNFRRLVVAEVQPHVVDSVRRAGGRFSVNIAHADRVEIAGVGPVEMADPASAEDRSLLVEAVAQAQEIATAVPSVQYYTSSSPGSIHCILAAGLRKKTSAGAARAVVYAAENHNHAAEILEAHVLDLIPPAEREAVHARVRFLNTVIGKMSGVVSDEAEVRQRGLSPISPRDRRAFLVEAFNRIFISRILFNDAGSEPVFRRGIEVFQEKDDLMPFEEAKLYGHNATHALAAYVGAVMGVQRIADLAESAVFSFLRAAFLEESGQALICRHQGVDPLFTSEGYREYADDLLLRMCNPFLGDTVERVGRDPARKLSWDDRLVGTMRVALRAGIIPRRFAFGAAAALAAMDPSFLEGMKPASAFLEPIWREQLINPAEKERVLPLIEEGRRRLRFWCDRDFSPLESLF